MTCFGFVEAERAQFPVSLLCRVVGVTRQGYYAWKRRGPSDRELADIDSRFGSGVCMSRRKASTGPRESRPSSDSLTASVSARSVSPG